MIDLFQGLFALPAAVGLVVMMHREPHLSTRVLLVAIAGSLALLGLNDLMIFGGGARMSADVREIVRTVLYGGIFVFVAHRLAHGYPHELWRESRQ